MIRLMLVDDQTIFREGLRKVIEDWEGIEVTCCASSLEEAAASYEEARPDVVLMEACLAGIGGASDIGRMTERFPDARIVALSASEADADLFGAIEAGARGYLLKSMPIEGLHDCVRAAARDEGPLSAAMAAKCIAVLRRMLAAERAAAPADAGESAPAAAEAASAPTSSLTPREGEILALLTEGLSNQQIASILVISEKTVKKHLNSIFVKLDVANRSQAAVYAIRAGLS